MLIGRRKPAGEFCVDGAGDSPARGVVKGEMAHLGDAAESVLEAVRKAEQAAGSEIGALYFNFDDPKMESIRSSGTLVLKGEGEIGPADIAAACDTATRLAAHFERHTVYARELGFVIDDKDPVADPLGVYGRKLEVQMHFIRARSVCVAAWRDLMRRAHFSDAAAVPSAWSVAYGILPAADRSRHTVLLDLGADFLNGVLFAENRLRELVAIPTPREAAEAVQALAAKVALWKSASGDIDRILVTGDLASQKEWTDLLAERTALPVHVSGPWAVPKLGDPRFASVVGLLEVAGELQGKTAGLRREEGLLKSAKARAVSFIQEYF
ncbi:MAG: hypothetical protein HYZ87_01735 [Candidatus Omnitrophica bacterium]|nr:hypothetical protein [Candidatus Omnitrophota bacterium]